MFEQLILSYLGLYFALGTIGLLYIAFLDSLGI